MYSSSIPLTQWCQMSPPSAIHKHLNKCFGQEPRCDSQVLTGQMRNLAKDNVPYVDEPKDYKALSHLKQRCGCLLRGCLFHQETLQFSTGLTATSVCLQGPGTPEQVSVGSSPWYTWFFLKTETKLPAMKRSCHTSPRAFIKEAVQPFWGLKPEWKASLFSSLTCTQSSQPRWLPWIYWHLLVLTSSR